MVYLLLNKTADQGQQVHTQENLSKIMIPIIIIIEGDMDT